MNLLIALTTVRNCSLLSAQMRTKHGQAARKVIDRKIQGLMRKKAWRDSNGAVPVHMGDESFIYPIESDPVTSALISLVRAERASRDQFTAKEIADLEAAIKQATAVLTEIHPELFTP
jgi:hypothetical protein